LRKKNLRKIDIVKNLSISTGYSFRLSNKLIDDLILILLENINKGKLNIKNLGTFRKIFKNKRIGRNPKTKEEFIISARNVISFNPSKTISKEINRFHE
tara:strand:- start:150 stop:446 length:297 start_codon:yes stop_codon:yes gene_type:complete